MGNTPSKEPQGRPLQRLSKPRNASHATAGLLKPNGPSTTAQHSSEPGPGLISIPYSATSTPRVSDDDDETDGDADTSKRASFLGTPQRRLSVFRSKSSQDANERRRSRRNTIIGPPSFASESPLVARANSVNTHNLGDGTNRYSGLFVPENRSRPGCRATWGYDQSYEAEQVLNLVPERPQERPPRLPRSNTSTSLYVPKRQEMQPPPWRRGSLPVNPIETAAISRSDSEMSLHPPMRRRSMVQTPGVATRSVRPGSVTRPNARHSLAGTPNLSRKPSLEIDDSIPSVPPLPTPYRLEAELPRVSTPKDGEYRTTGAFKYGSLRITNGSPDLTPAGSSDSEAQGVKPTVSCTDYFSAIPPSVLDVTSETKVDRVQASTQLVEPPTLDVTSPDISESNSYSSNHKFNVSTLSINVPVTGSGSRYAFDLNMSPMGMEEEDWERSSLEIQTKHTADEDHLFAMDDDSQSEISAVEKLDVRVDPSAKGLPPQSLDDPTQTDAQGVKRTDSGFVSNSVSVSSTSHNSLTKADSGYSSSVSLRSVRSGIRLATEQDTGRGSTESVRRSPEVADEDRRHAMELQIPSPILASDSSSPRTPETLKAPTPPPKDATFPMQADQSLPRNADSENARARLMSPSRARRKAARNQLPNIDIGHAGDRISKTSEPFSPSPGSAKSDASESASLSIGSNSQKQGRLHRLLSLKSSGFSKTPLTVHVTHAVDKQVPSVPKEVRDKLREHTGRFPMTTKRLALRSQMSKETLKTILSVGSLELAMEDEFPPTPCFFDADSDDEDTHPASGDAVDHSLKQTISSMQSNFKQAAASMMPSRNSIKRKPVATHKELQEPGSKRAVENDGMLAAEAELTSYHSVNNSLGNNAYDVAAQAMTEARTQPGKHAGRTMTLTTGQSNHLQLRTYSLNSMPSSPRDAYLSPPSPIPRAVSPPKKRRSPPPVTMETQSFRPPPPRSPLSPQGPAVLRKKSREAMRSPTNNSSDVPPIPILSDRRYLKNARGNTSTPSNYRAADWDPRANQNALGLQMPTLDHSRHQSLTSIECNLFRESTRARPSGQHSNDPILKHQPKLDGLVQNHVQAGSMSHPAHHGPRPRSLSQSEHNSKLVEGHQWNQQSCYPPYVPRAQHRRNLSAGPCHAADTPPYRILHSYNSPAYRNAPIWG